MDFGAVTQSQFGEVVGFSPQRVSQLVRDGKLPISKARKIPLAEGVQALLRLYREENKLLTKTAAQRANTEARTKVLDLRIAKEKAELVPMDDSLEIVTELTSLVRLGLDSLPARLSRDLAERQRIEAECDQILVGLSRAADEKIAALAGGKAGMDAAEEDEP